MPPSHKKIYIPLSLVHLIYTAGDKRMRQNACSQVEKLMAAIFKSLMEDYFVSLVNKIYAHSQVEVLLN